MAYSFSDTPTDQGANLFIPPDVPASAPALHLRAQRLLTLQHQLQLKRQLKLKQKPRNARYQLS